MKFLKVVLVILAIVFATSSTVRADLITNGDFETGDLTGWTEVGDTPGSWYVIGIPMGATPYSGSYNATTTNWLLDWQYIGQTIPTTIGQSYAVGFYLSSADDQADNEFVARWDGVTMIQLLNLAYSSPYYTYYSYTAIATGPSTTIDFGYIFNAQWFDLDDVSVNQVSAVPEPATMLLLGLGLVGLAGVRKKFQK
jgi:hypothetical protein